MQKVPPGRQNVCTSSVGLPRPHQQPKETCPRLIWPLCFDFRAQKWPAGTLRARIGKTLQSGSPSRATPLYGSVSEVPLNSLSLCATEKVLQPQLPGVLLEYTYCMSSTAKCTASRSLYAPLLIEIDHLTNKRPGLVSAVVVAAANYPARPALKLGWSMTPPARSRQRGRRRASQNLRRCERDELSQM